MIIACQQCKTLFNLNDELITKPNFLVRCSKCGYVFSAYKPFNIKEIPFRNLQAAHSITLHNIIAISNQKGGVAKTSTCLNLGAALAMIGKQVLLVDFDIQANLTISLGMRSNKSFYDVIQNAATDFSEFILPTPIPNLSLIPSNKNMVLLNKKYFTADNFEFILVDRLQEIVDHFEYILIDTPPSVDLFTLNALTAAGKVVIPCQCDYLSTHGVDQIMKIIKLVRNKTNPNIQTKILVTMYDQKNVSCRMIYGKIQKLYPDMIFKTIIEQDPKLKEAQIMHLPVMQYDPQSKSGLGYSQLAQEVGDWNNNK